LRQEHEKQEKKTKKRMLEEMWAMMRWITSYIDENEEKWARDKKERQETQIKWQEDCARMARHEKIRKIKENAPSMDGDQQYSDVSQAGSQGLAEQQCSVVGQAVDQTEQKQ
jgi:hypothetical protein